MLRSEICAAIASAVLLLSLNAQGEKPPKETKERVEAVPDHAPSLHMKRKVRWDPRWKKFQLANYLTTGGLLTLSLASLAIPPDPERWTQTNVFDNSIRSAVRLTSVDDQYIARDASDVTLAASINQLLVDALVVTWWGHDNGEVAWQMALMSIEALAYNNAVNGLVSSLTSRERPYGHPIKGDAIIGNRCIGENQELLDDCRSNKRYRSFYSGHTSTAFTIAGLTCMHHSQLPLYGGGAADALACAAGFALAGATGVLRMVGEQHWASDVLVGAAMGTFHGFAIPWLLHYRTGDLPEEPKAGTIHWTVVPNGTGAGIMGVF